MEARNMITENEQKMNSFGAQCVAKWGSLLEETNRKDPILMPRVRQNTAILMENMSRHLLEDTTSSNAGYFTKYVFPVLRRVWPNLIANQVVSVQPMNAPVGGVFYFEKKYSDRKGTKVPAAGVSGVPTAMAYTGDLDAGDKIIQNFAKYYSSEFVDFDAVCTDTGTTPATLTQASTNCRVTSWKPIRSNGTVGQRTFYVKAYYRILDADLALADTACVATMNDSGDLIDQFANTVGTFAVSTGNWSITPKGSSGTASNFVSNTVVYFQYFVNWEQVGYTSGASIPSVDLEITMLAIQAESRKLKAKWTVEAVEDMRALHGVDAEQEIVNTFANEVLMEIDREIISDLVAGAAHAASYSYSATVPGEIEAIRKMFTQIGALSARIHKTSGRGPANFIVCGPDVQSLMDQVTTHGDYKSIESDVQAPSYGPLSSDYGISRVGTLLRKWAVYVDPYMNPTQVLVGLKGNSYYDAGYVYAPYIPLTMTPTFLDPNDQTNRKGVWSRYATRMLRPEYYGVLTVSGLPSVSTTL